MVFALENCRKSLSAKDLRAAGQRKST